jgi:hypothetical protein
VAVVLQRPAVVCEDEGKLGVVKGGIAPMDRHVMARAQEHYVLNPVLAALADLAFNLRQHDLARLWRGLIRHERRQAPRDQIDADEARNPSLLGRILLGKGSLAGPVRAGNDDNPGPTDMRGNEWLISAGLRQFASCVSYPNSRKA